MAKKNFFKRFFSVVIPFILFFILFSYLWNYCMSERFYIILSNNSYELPLRFILPLVHMYPETYFMIPTINVYAIWFLFLFFMFLFTFIASKLLNKHFDKISAGIVRYQYVLITVVVAIFLYMSFQLGMHWHGILADNVNLKKLTNLRCYAHNNLEETYQLSCFSPFQTFTYKKDLNCQTLMNHQMSNDGIENIHNEFLTIRADYMSFKLHIKKERIDKPPTAGEFDKPAFKIVFEDENTIQAVRNAEIDSFFGDVYEYISLSKKSGKGILSWFNSRGHSFDRDSMAMEYFQCK